MAVFNGIVHQTSHSINTQKFHMHCVSRLHLDGQIRFFHQYLLSSLIPRLLKWEQGYQTFHRLEIQIELISTW